MKKVFFALIVLVLLSFSVCAYAEEWAWTNKSLAGSTGMSSFQRIDASNFAIAYRIVGPSGSFISSSDKGQTWSSPVSITTGTVNAISLAAKDTTTFYAAYSDTAASKVKLSKSINKGVTWTSSDIASSITFVNNNPLRIAYTNTSSNDNLYVVYYDATSTNLKLSKSTNGGTLWSTSTIDAQASAGFQPSMSVVTVSGNDKIGITYYAANGGTPIIRFAYSGDSGATWTTSTVDTLTSASATISQSDVKLGLSGTKVYVSYANPTTSTSFNNYLKFAYSSNSGSTWTKGVVDPIVNRGFGNAIDISVLTNTPSGIFITIAYSDDTNFRTLLATSGDNGVTWTTNSVIDNVVQLGYPVVSTLKQVSINEMYLTYSDTTTLKFANSVPFSSVSQTVQSVTGLGVMKSPTLWGRVKDASDGDNIDNGVIAVGDYEWDGLKFQRRVLYTGNSFYSVKLANIGASSVNIPFGFKSRKVIIETPAGNSDEICIDYLGGTAICPAANTAGNDRMPAGRLLVLDNHAVLSISVIAASGTQTIYVRAFR